MNKKNKILKMEKVLATLNVMLMDNQIDYDGIYRVILKFPEKLRKFIPYRGYVGIISVDENLIGSVYQYCECSDKLFTINFENILKIDKDLNEKLKEISNFIEKSEYDKSSGLYKFIKEETELALPVFKLVKLNSKNNKY